MFWGTIVVLALLYGYAQLKVARLALDGQGRVIVSERFYRELQQALPEVFGDMREALDAASGAMEQVISDRIDAAFAAVYDRVPTFLDFHYSVVGEYTELSAALTDAPGAELERILFTESGFQRHLDGQLAAIAAAGDRILGDTLEEMSRGLQERLALDGAETALLSGAVTLTIDDAMQRFGPGELMIKGAGAAIGAGAAAAAIAKTLGTKLGAKLAAKTAGKTALKASGAGGGAASGALAGLLCGPAAWVCAPVAAVAAGAAAWLATDKVVIEVDEYLHREWLEGELRAAIDAERDRIKALLVDLYRQRLQRLLEHNETQLKGIRTRELIERGT
jgi:hypothetical protein